MTAIQSHPELLDILAGGPRPAEVLRDRASGEPEYRPFPNEAGRNWRQEHIEIPLMLTALGLPRRARVLEVGCGRGVALPVLARRLEPVRLVGLDVDAGLLAHARRRVEVTGAAVELEWADVRRLPFADGAFDVVIDFGTCFHIAGADRALREIARVLAPGGLFATETRLSQFLAHPVRSFGRILPWSAAKHLVPLRRAALWEARRKEAA